MLGGLGGVLGGGVAVGRGWLEGGARGENCVFLLFKCHLFDFLEGM